MDDISQWLEQHGLGKYAKTFAESAIDFDVLADLEREDLKDLGIPVGDIRRLLRAIGELEQEPLARRPSEKRRFGAAEGAASAREGEAERRQLTIMFADLVGSTELARRLDPEDLRKINRAYQDLAKEAIELFGGYVARYMGDGVLAYFGYPQGYEDAAERAIRAGLRITRSLSGLGTGSHPAVAGVELRGRVGVATGPVVVGDLIGEGASQENAVVGETPNLAARLQGIAPANAVAVADLTRELASGAFEWQLLGARSLKGFDETVRAWIATGETAPETRFRSRHQEYATPMVGRDRELALMLSRWQSACGGEGQALLVSGEAGIGKSRLTSMLDDRVSGEAETVIRLQCSAYHSSSTLYPIAQYLTRVVNADPSRAPSAVLASLSRDAGLDESAIRVLTTLLSMEEKSGTNDLSAQELKERTLSALLKLVLSASGVGPVLLVVEDVHWIDPTTLELLERLAGELVSASLLLVLTARPEFELPWRGHAHTSVIVLNRLTRGETEQLAQHTVGNKALAPPLLSQIVRQTDGIPLFVEELTRSVIESGVVRDTGEAIELAIPPTLQDSLIARLDRMGEAKFVAQTAAVIGRDFRRDLLGAISPPSGVAAALEKLVDAGVVYRRGYAPETYTFHHALIRDAAYDSLLRARRSELHREVAESLEARFPELSGSQPELLAQHFGAAGILEKSIEYWHRAAARAIGRSALVEARSHCEAALSSLRDQPLTPELASMEVELNLLLASAHAANGPDAQAAYARAGTLADAAGDDGQLFRANFGLFMGKQQTGKLDEARALADELVVVATRRQDPSLELEACHAGWTARFLRDELRSVVELAGRGLALYDVEQHRDHRYSFGHDPGMCAHSVRAMSHICLGFADQARRGAENAVALAEELAHPVSSSYALSLNCHVFRFRREAVVVEQWIERQLALCEEYGFVGQAPFGEVFHGWARAMQGDTEAGIFQIRRALEAIRGLGIKTLAFPLTALAEAHIAAGEHREAMEANEEALAVATTVGESRWEPEVFRLRGSLLLATTGEHEAAEAAYRKALGLARAQEARWFELRAATDLARLMADEGRRGPACELLGGITQWFTEATGTADLSGARTLLAQLA